MREVCALRQLALDTQEAEPSHRPSYPDWKLGNGLVELVAHFKVQVIAEADVEIDFERVMPCALKDMLQLQVNSRVIRRALLVISQQTSAKCVPVAVADRF